MSPDPYKQSLTDAAARLIYIRELLFDATFQVAITNELRDWSDTVEEERYTPSRKSYWKAAATRMFNC